MRHAFCSLSMMAAMFAFQPMANAQWADVEMTFLYDGKPPEPKPVAESRDGLKILDQTWLVDKEGGVKNVVVRLLPEKDVKLPIHPDFEKAKGTNVRVDIVGGYFEPRVTIKYTNQDLTFTNLNPFAHTAKADLQKNSPFNMLVQTNKLVTLEAEKNGLNLHDPAVGMLSDSIHPEMRGYLFIHSHPYAGVSDHQGNVTLKNVPLGEWTFVMWHEANGYIKKGALDGAAAEWPKGRIEFKVEPQVNKIGTIRFK
ncbi:MAG: hypothetical protein IAF94_12345 [Pirellulaceae bacterium]|nr:hypothetical protein [Pirellulaceae bacterium]